MRRIAVKIVVFVALIACGAAVYFLLIGGRPPARRPDLVRLPDGMPVPPKGYPTYYAALLSLFLGRLELVDYLGNIGVPPGVVERKDIEYGRVGDRSLQLDLYTPTGEHEPLPGLVFIHGGGWKEGNRSDYKYYTVRFADRGYVVATVSYRFSDEAKFPAAVQDVKCAVRWLRANAEGIGLDPNRIAAVGGSAGGYLAMMVGYSAGVPKLEGTGGNEGVSSAVQAVVDLYGPPDLTMADRRDDPVVPKFLGATYEEAPERYDEASPMYYLDKNDPPTLIIHGTIDNLVPVTHADLLAERLRDLGVPYWYDRLDGWPHMLDAAEATNDRVQFLMNAFFDRFLKGEPKTPKQ